MSSQGGLLIIALMQIPGLMAMRFDSATSSRLVSPIGNTKLRPV